MARDSEALIAWNAFFNTHGVRSVTWTFLQFRVNQTDDDEDDDDDDDEEEEEEEDDDNNPLIVLSVTVDKLRILPLFTVMQFNNAYNACRSPD